MKSIEDVVMEHVEKTKGLSSTSEAKGLLELPEKWEFNTAGNLYLASLRIIKRLKEKIAKLEEV
jgi:hypothetical protein